jgi:tetratricopeptide (TPR) repeat protein
MREETRAWMQQRILADIARCYHLLGQIGQACEHFMILVNSDPKTPWFDRIPLSWSAQQVPADVADQARQWLRQADQPIATLMGGSWLLSGADRDQAVQALQRLTRNADRRIASLAEAQLWRIRVNEASSDTVANWQAQAMAMPRSLQAGPCFVVGTALAHQQQHQRAALVLLRVPILYPRHRNLAAESLWAAGEALDQAGQRAEARSVFRELRQNYPQDPLSRSAEQRIRALSDPARGATATGAPE